MNKKLCKHKIDPIGINYANTPVNATSSVMRHAILFDHFRSLGAFHKRLQYPYHTPPRQNLPQANGYREPPFISSMIIPH